MISHIRHTEWDPHTRILVTARIQPPDFQAPLQAPARSLWRALPGLPAQPQPLAAILPENFTHKWPRKIKIEQEGSLAYCKKS